MRAVLLVCFVNILGACGGGDDGVDLTGMYSLDVTVGSEPCGVDQPTTTPAPYLKFYREEIFGQKYWAYDACMDLEGTDCSQIGGLINGFYEVIDRGWLGETSGALGSGSDCTLFWEVRLALFDDPSLVIDIHRYMEDDSVSEAQCSTEEAERRGDGMPCAAHSSWEATRL